MLTLERATELNETMVHEDHLILHAKNVCYAMGAMAEHFGEDKEHWEAVGMLHDYDYEKYPDEHLRHTEKPLLEAPAHNLNNNKYIIAMTKLQAKEPTIAHLVTYKSESHVESLSTLK